MRIEQLSINEISQIRNRIKTLREEKHIVNVDIKDDVFALLEKECKVLFYPIDDLNLWALYQKEEHANGDKRCFVFINSKLPYEKQIFAAAHELAHVWNVNGAGDSAEVLLGTDDETMPIRKTDKEKNKTSKKELVANRFAAEFLMDEDTVRKLYSRVDKDTIIDDREDKLLALTLALMDYYIAPFKMTVKRLHELELIADSEMEDLLKHYPREKNGLLERLQLRLGLCEKNNKVTERKKFSDFVNLAVEDYKRDLISFSKLKQLLSLFDLSPEKLGVEEPAEKVRPTVEEIEALLEEE
jgi:Zn-dependent peptidase ImmA (M78 family)